MTKFSFVKFLRKLNAENIDYVVSPCPDNCFSIYRVDSDGLIFIYTFSDFRLACDYVSRMPAPINIIFASRIS